MFLSDEQILKYKIMSREACERYCKQKHDRSSVVISIKSTWDRVDPKVFANDINGVKHILFLAIDDIEAEDDPRFAMNEDQGKIVADFVNAYYDETDRIIIHCDGGISRSAGVGAAIMRVKEGSDYPVFRSRRKSPNMTCYLVTLKGFGYI